MCISVVDIIVPTLQGTDPLANANQKKPQIFSKKKD
jgi:hypothetical protein